MAATIAPETMATLPPRGCAFGMVSESRVVVGAEGDDEEEDEKDERELAKDCSEEGEAREGMEEGWNVVRGCVEEDEDEGTTDPTVVGARALNS